MPLYTDSGLPADRVDVTTLSGGLAQAVQEGGRFWVPEGSHSLPPSAELLGAVDVVAHPGAAIAVPSKVFVNGIGTLKWKGGTFTGNGSSKLFDLNAATQLPAHIEVTDARLIGVWLAAWNEWTIEPHGRIGKIVSKRLFSDLLGIGRGIDVANGAIEVDFEDWEIINFKRFGLACYCHGNFPDQQAALRYARYKNITLRHGRGGGSSATNSNAMYVGGQNVDIDGLTIEDWLPPQDAEGAWLWSDDGDEMFYSKTIHLSLRNARLWSGTSAITLKGHQWGNTTGPGPVGGGALVENVVIGREADWPLGMSAVLDQSRGVQFRNIETVRLNGGHAFLNHQTSGATIIDGWRDHERAAAPADNDRAIFNNRSDQLEHGVLTILNSSVDPQFDHEAVNVVGSRPAYLIDDIFNNSWRP